MEKEATEKKKEGTEFTYLLTLEMVSYYHAAEDLNLLNI